ncbi:MAG: hypothetical protein RLZZ111_1220 [Planctomycetota bacterium]
MGGGPGGLFTAFLLERETARPLRITLYEATDRPGGKVLSPRFAAAPVRYEAGAAEFYEYTPVGDDPLRDLVEGLGLPTVPLGGSAVVIDGATVGNLDDIGRRLGPAARRAVETFDQRARGAMTPREFYAADETGTGPAQPFSSSCARIADPAARRYIESLIHSDLATEPESTSVSYGLQNYLMNDPAYMRLYGIAGGNEQLIDAIVARLAADMRLGWRVEEVAPAEEHRLRLTTREAATGMVRCEEFDAVVLALPIQHLAGIRAGSERLAGAMRSHLARFDHPAHYLRVTILFDEPFWRGRFDGGYAMLDAFGGCCLYDESARDPEPRHGVLGWLLGGSAAADWADADDDALVAAVLDSLPESFGAPRRHLLEARVHRWINAVSALPGGWQPPHLDRRHQPDPVGHPNLFVVGDYLFDSTLNGVLDSAAHVAGWLASRCG